MEFPGATRPGSVLRKRGLVAEGFGVVAGGAGGDVEGGEVVGFGGVEAFPIIRDELGEVEFVLLDAEDDALGEFVAAVVAVVGAFLGVGEEGLDVGGADGFVKGFGIGVEVDEGDAFVFGDLAGAFDVVAVGVDEGVGDLAFLIEGLAVHGGDDDGGGAFGGFDEFFVDVGVGGQVGVAFFLHVVVAVLDEEVVAGFDLGEDLVEAVGALGTAEGFAGLGLVGDGDAGLEEAGEHLAPGVVGLGGLVADGGVADDVDGGDVGFFDGDGGDAGVFAVELEGEFVVPVPDFGGGFAGLEVDVACARPAVLGDADVDGDGAGDGFAGRSGEGFEHEAAEFGFDGGGGGGVGVAEGEGDGVVAFGDLGGEVEGFVGGGEVAFGGGGVAGFEAVAA